MSGSEFEQNSVGISAGLRPQAETLDRHASKHTVAQPGKRPAFRGCLPGEGTSLSYRQNRASASWGTGGGGEAIACGSCIGVPMFFARCAIWASSVSRGRPACLARKHFHPSNCCTSGGVSRVGFTPAKRQFETFVVGASDHVES